MIDLLIHWLFNIFSTMILTYKMCSPLSSGKHTEFISIDFGCQLNMFKVLQLTLEFVFISNIFMKSNYFKSQYVVLLFKTPEIITIERKVQLNKSVEDIGPTIWGLFYMKWVLWRACSHFYNSEGISFKVNNNCVIEFVRHLLCCHELLGTLSCASLGDFLIYHMKAVKTLL